MEDFDKITQDKQAVLNPKHKILEKCLPALKTDENLCAAYNGFLILITIIKYFFHKGKKLMTSAGVITSQTLKSAHIS